MEIKARNTNQLASAVYRKLFNVGVQRPSRNGDVLMFPDPVTIVLNRPWERVNFCPQRDANPFFHLWEGLAMLAGYNSAQFLTWLAAQMKNYSDDGVRYNAFYGDRARIRWGDQLARVVELLRNDPDTRRAVVQFWDPLDLYKVSKDMACNTSLMFGRDPLAPGKLRMTTTNRSNDAIWGGVTGANIVHLSMIHEYVASMVGVEMGEWWHFSANLHVYQDNPKISLVTDPREALVNDPYSEGDLINQPLVYDRMVFDQELVTLVTMAHDTSAWWADMWLDKKMATEPFLTGTAVPMFNAYLAHKRKMPELAAECASGIVSDDWRVASQLWLERRAAK